MAKQPPGVTILAKNGRDTDSNRHEPPHRADPAPSGREGMDRHALLEDEPAAQADAGRGKELGGCPYSLPGSGVGLARGYLAEEASQHPRNDLPGAPRQVLHERERSRDRFHEPVRTLAGKELRARGRNYAPAGPATVPRHGTRGPEHPERQHSPAGAPEGVNAHWPRPDPSRCRNAPPGAP